MKKSQRGAVAFNNVAKWNASAFNDPGGKAAHCDGGISPSSKIWQRVQHADGAIGCAQRPRHRFAVDEHSVAVAGGYYVLHDGESVRGVVGPLFINQGSVLKRQWSNCNWQYAIGKIFGGRKRWIV